VRCVLDDIGKNGLTLREPPKAPRGKDMRGASPLAASGRHSHQGRLRHRWPGARQQRSTHV